MSTTHRTVRHTAAFAAVSLLAALLSACGPEILPPSGPHPPLTLEQVKLYQAQPAKYEVLGVVEVPVTAEMKWDERGDSTAGFEALKSRAAALGANGVLLMMDASKYDHNVGAGYKGKYYLVPVKYTPRTAMAQAIFVVKE